MAREKYLMSLMHRLSRRYRNAGEVNTLKNRIFNQKCVFLLENMGISNLKYRYNWYIYGPYSPDLALDLYSNQPLLEMMKADNSTSQSLSGEEDIRRFEEMFTELENVPSSAPIETKLEFLASAVYLKNRLQSVNCENIEKMVSEAISKSKPAFRGWDLAPYWKVIEKYNVGS